jgi:hypothetical protein
MSRAVGASANEVGFAANPYLLFRLRNRVFDLGLTLTVALVVGWSRLGCLADGPWEWDEVAFARAVLDFDLAAYFPHPPGFPGWLAIGHLLTPIAGEPLLALQVGSAAFSIIALWLLAALGRKVAPPTIAVLAAVVVLVAPGPWLFAVRGFSSTTAAVLALAAAVVVSGGLDGRRPTTFTLLLTASFLVRPNLLPVLGVFWLAVALQIRPRVRLLPGVVAGVGAVVVAVALMAYAEGGWGEFFEPFISHSQRHTARLGGNLGGYADLGLVKGLGGVLAATLMLSAASIGVVIWARRVSRKAAWLWAVVLAVAVAQLLWLQGRTGCRYAVGVQMALAPLAAGAAAAAPPVVGYIGLLAAAGWLGAGSLPLVLEQHNTQLAGWRAVQWAQDDAGRSTQTVVVESELHLFASYLWHLRQWRGQPTPPRVLSPWDLEPWAGVDGSYLVATVHRHFYPGSLYGREINFGGASQEIWPLTQQRFHDAWVIEDPPLPIQGWWPVEMLPGGRTFMWGAADARLLMPPMPDGAEIWVVFRPAEGPDPLLVEFDRREVAKVTGSSEEHRLRFTIAPSEAGKVTELRFARDRGYAPGNDDSRPLAVQLFELRASDPSLPWAARVAHPWQRRTLNIELKGAYQPEDFAGFGAAVWLGPQASLVVPAREGRLMLRLWAPRPTPPRTVVMVGGRRAAGPLELGSLPTEVAIQVQTEDITAGSVEIQLLSESYVPSQHGRNDSRELGIVLSVVGFEPLVGRS